MTSKVAEEAPRRSTRLKQVAEDKETKKTTNKENVPANEIEKTKKKTIAKKETTTKKAPTAKKTTKKETSTKKETTTKAKKVVTKKPEKKEESGDEDYETVQQEDGKVCNTCGSSDDVYEHCPCCSEDVCEGCFVEVGKKRPFLVCGECEDSGLWALGPDAWR